MDYKKVNQELDSVLDRIQKNRDKLSQGEKLDFTIKSEVNTPIVENKISVVINQCNSCKADNDKESIYCKSCGNKLIKETIITVKKCEQCGKEYDDTYIFCSVDGGAIIKEEVIKEIQNKDSVYNEVSNSPNEELGFGWGNFYLVMGIIGTIMQIVASALLALTIFTSSVYVNIFYGLILLSGILINGIIIFGLYYRKKWFLSFFKMGIILLFITLPFNYDSKTVFGKDLVAIVVNICFLDLEESCTIAYWLLPRGGITSAYWPE